MSCDDVLSRWDGRNNGQEIALPQEEKRVKVLEVTGGSNLAPQLLTLSWSIGVNQKNNVMAGTRRSIRGYVEFGVANISHEIAFDLGRGGAITVAASAISFVVTHVFPPIATSPIVTVKGSLSYGTKPGTIPSELVLTDPLGPILGNRSTNFREVPAFATTVSVQGTPFRPFVLQNIEIAFFNSGGTELTRFAPQTLGIADMQRIPSEASHYRVFNVGAADLDNTVAIFGLAL